MASWFSSGYQLGVSAPGHSIRSSRGNINLDVDDISGTDADMTSETGLGHLFPQRNAGNSGPRRPVNEVHGRGCFFKKKSNFRSKCLRGKYTKCDLKLSIHA